MSARSNTTNSLLWASAVAPNTWEKYDVVDAGNGFVSLRAKANNMYVSDVSARTNEPNGPLETRIDSIATREKFSWGN